MPARPAVDNSADLRLMFRQDVGPVRLLLDHTTLMQNGDAIALGRDPSSAVDQTVTDDARRLMDLTWEISDGDNHRALHRIDRLAMQWQPGNWSLTVGRQAVSWGSGIVFQPLDLFSPFSPTVVDRDYKAGDDLVLIDRLLPNGHDLQLLHVVRRDEDSDVTGEVASSALKWHGYAGPAEFEVVAAEHYDESVLGLSLRLPLGQALLRSDVVATRAEDMFGQEEWRVSGIINADLSFMVGNRNAYAFAEYFYNDWGVDDLPPNLLQLPPELVERLQRGEIFNLMRHYVAAGGNIEWHPLVNHQLTFIGNMHDGSWLMQMQVDYNPSDHQSIQFGWIQPLGTPGDEFGGVPVFTNPAVPSEVLTTGGASRVYLRWVYFM